MLVIEHKNRKTMMRLAWAVIAFLSLTACGGKDGNGHKAVPEPQGKYYTVAVDIPAAASPKGFAARNANDAKNFAVVDIDPVTGKVTAQRAVSSVFQNADGTWSVFIVGDLTANSLIVVNAGSAAPQITVGSVLPDDVLYSPLTDDEVKVDILSTIAYDFNLTFMEGKKAISAGEMTILVDSIRTNLITEVEAIDPGQPLATYKSEMNNKMVTQLTFYVKQAYETAPVLLVKTAVADVSNDVTPNYAFSSTEAGTIQYSGDCVSATTTAIAGINTITFNTLALGQHTNCSLTVTDVTGNVSLPLLINVFSIIDIEAPVISQVTPVPEFTDDNTPNFIFSANKAGVITYAGSCASSTTSAVAGNNTVTFNTLVDGDYTNCQIFVTDLDNHQSNTLSVLKFTVDTNNDKDEDGINNTVDNCAVIVNPDQMDTDADGKGNVCDADDDGDAIGDAFDNCPLQSNNNQLNTDSDAFGDECDADDDSDAVLDVNDNCSKVVNLDQLNQDNDNFGDVCDSDVDGDTRPNIFDNCPLVNNAAQLDFDADTQGDECDTDDDNDTVLDANDNCSFVSNLDQLNTDGDLKGNACDTDDDNDSVLDTADNCALLVNADQLNTDGDTQGDVCDADDDNDSILDASDNCILVSNNNQLDSDNDVLGNVCDNDDDNDGVLDSSDNCLTIDMVLSADVDADGCDDADEDLDDDNDSVLDGVDSCATADHNLSADADADGCDDADEDLDDDSDGVLDTADNCLTADHLLSLDLDNDGCDDVDEDGDDDNDAVFDGVDSCITADNNLAADNDHDGCDDADEDGDDDNDGVLDTADNCLTIDMNLSADIDADGCDDADEDSDDDNDSMLDAFDTVCPNSPISGDDFDFDGCKNVEDLDDDSDGMLDTFDNCLTIDMNLSVDIDADGCDDADEDTNVVIPDTTAPVLAQVTAVPSPTNDTTPDYTFSSSEAGVITYGGACSSSTIAAVAGNNTITLNALAPNTYSNCTIVVTDMAGNSSESLSLNTFASPFSGFVTSDLGTSLEMGLNVVAQNDGKILVTGDSDDNDFILVRYNSDGSLDTSFSSDGKVRTDIFELSDDTSYGVVVQSDGKILVSGSARSGGASGNSDFALVRYNSDGSLDTSFSDDGKVTTDFGLDSNDEAYFLAVQNDGKIIVAGVSDQAGSPDFALVRYNTDGSLDTTFNDDGKVVTDIINSSQEYIPFINILDDGKILIVGNNYHGIGHTQGISIVRYNSDGSLDTGFGIGGIISSAEAVASPMIHGAAVQDDGKIIMAIRGIEGILVRYNSDGSLDETFANNGYYKTSVALIDNDGLYSVAIQSDGKIVFAASVSYTSPDFAVLRLNADGSLDTSFGEVGLVTTDFLNNYVEVSFAVALQNDGKILVTGGALVQGVDNADFALARYNPDGSLDTTFGAPNNEVPLDSDTDGVPDNADAFPDNNAASIDPDNDGFPDEWNVACDLVCQSTSGLLLDTLTNDSDNDTAGNDTDNCISIANADQVDSDTDGQGNACDNDDDNDSVVDANDQCLTIDMNLSADVDADGCDDADEDANVVIPDTTAPVLAEVTAVPSPTNDTTPDYTFSSTEAGVITYGGSCSSSTAVAVAGNNTITLNALANGSYVGCTITVTDSVNNTSSMLQVNLFVVQLGDGIVTTNMNIIGYLTSIDLLSDGKIVMAGTSHNGLNMDCALVRYNIDGSLDATFGSDGKLTTSIGLDHYCFDVVVQADGKILVVGSSSNEVGHDFALVRYNTDGSLDATFNNDGIVITDINSGYDDVATSLAIQDDGKILVAGVFYNGTVNKFFTLVRYNNDGSLDATFNGNGIVSTDIDSVDDFGPSLSLQTDGKILVAGSSSNGEGQDFTLMRYNGDGSLDITFSVDGIVKTDSGFIPDRGYSVKVQLDSKILVAGTSNQDITLVRYNSDGSLDNSFNEDGILATDIGAEMNIGFDIALQADDKILVSGTAYNGSESEFVLVRYNTDGTLDSTLSGDGIVSTDIGLGQDLGFNVKVQMDGKIVVAGSSNQDFAVVRYNPDGTLDTTFGASQ